MILILILLALGLIVGTVIELITMSEIGTPIPDLDLSEFLDKLETEKTPIELYRKWNDKFRLDFRKYKTPSIVQTQYSIVFPYYIDDVGVIPIWSSSYKRIKNMFTERIDESSYTSKKRNKLGL